MSCINTQQNQRLSSKFETLLMVFDTFVYKFELSMLNIYRLPFTTALIAHDLLLIIAGQKSISNVKEKVLPHFKIHVNIEGY